jgi:hypothetical protein
VALRPLNQGRHWVPERRRAAGLAARLWEHLAVVCQRPEVHLEAASYRRPEVHLEAASYRRPAACRGRRAVDRYAATARQSARLQPVGSSWLRRQRAACRGRQAADRSAAMEHQSARQPEVASS